MKTHINAQLLQNAFALLLFCCFGALSLSAQQAKFIKQAPCQKTISFQTNTTVQEYWNTGAPSDKKGPLKRGQFQLCLDARGNISSSGKGAFPQNLLEIEEFTVALRQSAGDIRPDFESLIRNAKERGALVAFQPDGTVSVKHRLRGGGQWVTLIDLRRQMLLGCSEYDREEFLVRKLVCNYFRDGRRPPQIQRTVFSEYKRQPGIKELFIKETITNYSEPVLKTRDAELSTTRSFRSSKF